MNCKKLHASTTNSIKDNMDSNLKNPFRDIQSENEVMLWSYQPKLAPFVMAYGELWFSLAFLLLFWAAFFVAEITTSERLVSWLFFPLMLLGIVVFIPALLAWRFLQHRRLAYGLSNKRIVIRSGVMWVNYKTIDLDKIQRMEVKKNMAQALFNTGTIIFHTSMPENTLTGPSPDQWEGIKEPYEVFRLIKREACRK